MKTVLTIAGSDCSGGAGIQADLKTITAHKMYAMSVITALTAQNTTGVADIKNVDTDFVQSQLKCVFTDIVPDAVKIGMVTNAEQIEMIAGELRQFDAKNLVVDPVMVSTSGRSLMEPEAVCVLVEQLMPLATVITPNIPEAEVLAEINIFSPDDMVNAAGIIYRRIYGSKPATHNQYSCCHQNEDVHAILIKGGHCADTADDLLYMGDRYLWYQGKRIENENTHGTGCTLSSAIACNLAMGYSVEESVKQAKIYITGAIRAGLNLGKGNGPLDHTYWLNIQGGESADTKVKE
jgi:hydroxymethylpyrimidine/phosphomethylpyrimidine kinase